MYLFMKVYFEICISNEREELAMEKYPEENHKNIHIIFLVYFVLFIHNMSATGQEHAWVRDESMFNSDGFSIENVTDIEWADMNYDGYLDVILRRSGKLEFYEGGDSNHIPRWTKNENLLSSLKQQNGSGLVLFDVDRDNKFEIITNIKVNNDWKLAIWKYTEANPDPVWQVDFTTFESIPLDSDSEPNNPAFFDADDDGDFDMIIDFNRWNSSNRLRYFENVGTLENPMWQEDSSKVTELNAAKRASYNWISPVWADSGCAENPTLFLIQEQPWEYQKICAFSYLRNSPGNQWESIDFSSTEFKADIYPLLEINVIDLNGDNFEDMAALFSGRGLRVYPNELCESEWQFSNDFYRIGGFKLMRNSSTVLFDHDEDGALDILFVGDFSAAHDLAKGPESCIRSSSGWISTNWSGLNDSDPGLRNYHFSILDLNEDSVCDLVYGGSAHDLLYNSEISFRLNNGTNQQFELTSVHSFDRFNSIDIQYYDPAFGDVDGDGLIDMLVRVEYPIYPSPKNFRFFSYVGPPDQAQWIERSDLGWGLSDSLANYSCLVDFDTDGDLDVVFGRADGKLSYFENIGNPQSPQWEFVGEKFQGIDVGWNAAPTFGDMDQDGDLDLVCGNGDGNLNYYRNDPPTKIHQNSSSTNPTDYFLFYNYPNPFNSSTFIYFHLLKSDFIQLEIFDILGRNIRTLISEKKAQGYYRVLWDGADSNGNPVASGLYFCRLKGTNYVRNLKITYLR